MTTKAGRKLDRLALFAETERLHEDPANYHVYVPASKSAELNEKIKSGRTTVTLKDVIEGKLREQ